MDVLSVVLTILTTFLTVAGLQYLFRRYRNFQVFERIGVPGPKPDFVLGNLAHMRAGPTRNDVISGWLKKYGDVFGYFVGQQPFLVIKDLELIKQVFVRDIHVFHDRAKSSVLEITMLRRALAGTKGKRWREMRHTLTPTFSPGKIKLMSQLVEQKVDITVSVVEKMCEKGEMFDIYDVFRGLTIDVIAGCAFAMKTECQVNPEDYFKQAILDYFRLEFSSLPMRMFYLFPSLAEWMESFNRRVLASANDTTRLILENIQVVIDERKSNPDVRSMDFLQLMLDSSKGEGSKHCSPLTDEEIVANAFGFLVAGYETTSTTLAFCFYALIKYPEIQEKLYREIEQAEDCTHSTVQNLKYLDQYLSETLRHYPPLSGFVSRECSRDHQVGTLTIPKGVSVIAPVWDIHHDPELWPDPWSFDPERFSPANKAKINNLAYLPFGLGARNCIGSRFALLEAKFAVFKLLKKFKFEMCEKTDDPLTLECSGSLINPKYGVYLRAVPRETS